MDDKDKQILRAVQSKLPIAEKPWVALGDDLGLSEDQVIARLKDLKERGIIRRIGGNFDSTNLGWAATLCGAKVPRDKYDKFIAAVNAYPGVTHNYRREHEFNVWFTFIAESMDQIEENLAKLAESTGVSDICSMPSVRKYKIKVDFPV